MFHQLFKAHVVESKHFTWYNNIIIRAKHEEDNRKSRKVDGEYFEKHHILPKSMGGSNDPINLVLLTPKEHFICHHLLYLFVQGPDRYKMAFAWNMLCWGSGKNKERPLYYNARLFSKARTSFAQSISAINSGPNIKLRSHLRALSLYGSTNYLFYNVDSGVHLFGTKFELLDLDASICLTEINRIIDNPSYCSKGWMIQLELDTLPSRQPKKVGDKSAIADLTVRVFVDLISQTEYSCNRHQLQELFPDRNITPQGITDLIKGRQKSHRGISIVSLT